MVIWIFERAGKQSRLEVLYLAPNKYEVRFMGDSGDERVEHFGSATDAGTRQIELENTLSSEGWERTGGWKL